MKTLKSETVKLRRQQLRNNSTPQEIILWNRLKRNQIGYKFRRQHSIGDFIADFYCPEVKLIIEIDGSQHIEHEKYDSGRTEYLSKLGHKVIRFWNNEINTNLDGVMMKIVKELERRIPFGLPATPPLEKGEMKK